MFGDYWGDHMDGKLNDVMILINEDNKDNCIKVLPTLDNNRCGSPQLLLTERPSEKCLDKLGEFYHINIFRTDNKKEQYQYLMTIEVLQYGFREDWCVWRDDDFHISVLGNKFEHDGFFYVTDTYSSERRVAIIPYARYPNEVGGGFNLSRDAALELTKSIVKRLNNKTIHG